MTCQAYGAGARTTFPRLPAGPGERPYDARHAPGASAGIVAALLVALAAARAPRSTDPPPTARATVEPLGATELRDAAVELVEQREAALTGGDRDAFLATVDEDELQFVATQARWFDNLSAMPVDDLRLEPVDGGAADGGTDDDAEDGELRLPVDFTMRLDGFEEHSVTQRLLYTFRQVDGEVLLVNDRDAARDRRAGWLPDPWDVGDVVVRESGSILAFFDEETAPYAELGDGGPRGLAGDRPGRGAGVVRAARGLRHLGPDRPRGAQPHAGVGDGRRRLSRPGPPRLAQGRRLPLHRQPGGGPQQPAPRVPAAPRAGPRRAGQQGRREPPVAGGGRRGARVPDPVPRRPAAAHGGLRGDLPRRHRPRPGRRLGVLRRPRPQLRAGRGRLHLPGRDPRGRRPCGT